MAAQIEKKEKKAKAKRAALGASLGREEKSEQKEEDTTLKEVSKRPLDATDLSKK